jgi:hypothetical protein
VPVKMTESFATTVVTVAPILWLVAAVEVQQSLKLMNASLEDSEAMLAEAKAALTAAADDSAAAHEWSVDQRRRLRSPDWGLPLFAAWGAITACLLVATFFALSWLAGVEDPPGNDEAAFCYYTLMLGLGAVTLIPVVVALIRGCQASARMGSLADEVDALRASARQRLSSRRESGAPPP